jgi:hypothetical protein
MSKFLNLTVFLSLKIVHNAGLTYPDILKHFMLHCSNSEMPEEGGQTKPFLVVVRGVRFKRRFKILGILLLI